MKHLIVALIIVAPFIGKGQIPSSSSIHPIGLVVYDDLVARDSGQIKSDTLRAYLLVTSRHMGIAYQKIGFVVKTWKGDIAHVAYLDCEKRIIKPPFNVWDYRIINPPQ